MTDERRDADVRKTAIEEIRAQYPPLLTTSHVAEMLHCTIGDVRDKVHSGELPAVRWGQQFRFFRDEILAKLEEWSLNTE
jgi:excisionase family DNA binding protein